MEFQIGKMELDESLEVEEESILLENKGRCLGWKEQAMVRIKRTKSRKSSKSNKHVTCHKLGSFLPCIMLT